MTYEPSGLLPCPFCGGTKLQYREDLSEDDPNRRYAFHVFCRDCHCHGRNNYPIGWCHTIQMAEEAWNDRSESFPELSDGETAGPLNYALNYDRLYPKIHALMPKDGIIDDMDSLIHDIVDLLVTTGGR